MKKVSNNRKIRHGTENKFVFKDINQTNKTDASSKSEEEVLEITETGTYDNTIQEIEIIEPEQVFRRSKRLHLNNISKDLESSLERKSRNAFKKEMKRVDRLRKKMPTLMKDNKNNINGVFLDDEKTIKIDDKIANHLKSYQIDGVKFMFTNCYESTKNIENKNPGDGCVLAHCCGLGKTLQVIALSHALITNNSLTKTNRILVLTQKNSLLHWCQQFCDWQRECETKIDIYKVSKRTTKRSNLLKNWYENGGVLIISYTLLSLLTQNSNKNSKANFKYLICPGADLVVCDEGHELKNLNNLIAKKVNSVMTKRRIVLTGLKLPNNLEEYHSMISFVKPHLLGTKKDFYNKFIEPISKGQDANCNQSLIQQMKNRLYILRRILSGCVQHVDYKCIEFIPPKHEFIIFIRLSEFQSQLYKIFLQNKSSNSQLFTDYHSLYLILTHPWLLKMKGNNNPFTSDQSELRTVASDVLDGYSTRCLNDIINQSMKFDASLSGKIVLLSEILKRCELTGDKLIVFSKSLVSLNFIENFLKYWNDNKHSKWQPFIDYFRIDGATEVESRLSYINEFNRPDSRARLFLVSTKSGGSGIDLVGANRVILFDVSWNHSNDLQAIYRVYRLGQKKPVFIYRFITQGTMEEKIYNLQVNKQSLYLRVIDEHQLDASLIRNELNDFYNFDPDINDGMKLSTFHNIPSDRLLTNLLNACDEWISKCHEHKFENSLEDDSLVEIDCIDAWNAYKREMQGI